MKTATRIKALSGWNGNAILYKLSEPLSGYNWDDDAPKAQGFDYVVVSAINNMFGRETYIFGVNGSEEAILKSIKETGDVDAMVNLSELPGSYKNGMDHEKALSGAGYTMSK